MRRCAAAACAAARHSRVHRVRNLVHDDQFDFPLRQRHIADATGLTVVHVNRVVGNLRRLGIIEIKGRTMTVHNLLELEHIVQ